MNPLLLLTNVCKFSPMIDPLPCLTCTVVAQPLMVANDNFNILLKLLHLLIRAMLSLLALFAAIIVIVAIGVFVCVRLGTIGNVPAITSFRNWKNN